MLSIKPKSSAFTLIELLVVVAIIGILASIVLASLNNARDRGKIAGIKSNLKNMGAQMELSYLDNNNYSGISTGGTTTYPDTTCIGPISDMAGSITNQGATVRCLSYNNSSYSDVYQRWGATALIYKTVAPVEAYSSSPSGVVKWDEQGVTTTGTPTTPDVEMSWTQANTACTLSGGRLPTLEELKTLADAECIARGNSSATCNAALQRNPPGFVASDYWSSVTVPSSSANAYYVSMHYGNVGGDPKSNYGYVRCVR